MPVTIISRVNTFARISRRLALFAAMLLSSGDAAVAAELPTAQEATQAKAVMAFNAGRFDDAIRLADGILKVAPQAYNPLELKALSLKALGKDSESLKIYGQLVRVAPRAKKPQYYFEIGTLLQKHKRKAQARVYLNAAIQGGFNVGASHFFLGMQDYEDKQWESAESHFRVTASSRAGDLKPYAQFYSALSSFRMGLANPSIRSLKDSLAAASPWRSSHLPERQKSAAEIIETSQKLLSAFDRGRFFGNFTLITQYDSNVTLLPDSITSATQTSGKRTLKQIFTGGAGYMTSPTRTIQFVGSYRTFFNFNFNSDAKTYDFFSHIGSIYLNYKPYARLTGGLRLDGTYTFQNQAGVETTMELHQYSLTGDLGPFVRYEINPRLVVGLDGLYRPKKFHGDPEAGDDRRSGKGFQVRASTEYQSGSHWLAPNAYVAYESDDTDGRNWRFSAFSFGLTNFMRVVPKTIFTLGLDYTMPDYSERRPVREDKNLMVRAAMIRELGSRFSLLVDAAYVKNTSTVASIFSYSRWYGGIGVSYSF